MYNINKKPGIFYCQQSGQYSTGKKISLWIYRNLGSVETLFFPLSAFSLSAARKVTPSLPKEGEAAQGEHPLDPLIILGFSLTF
ncbi:MAG: hypothetical protein WC620_04210 [Methanoregula sp.]|jgi:hypothetical protein